MAETVELRVWVDPETKEYIEEKSVSIRKTGKVVDELVKREKRYSSLQDWFEQSVLLVPGTGKS
jgi:hypothetical protein